MLKQNHLLAEYGVAEPQRDSEMTLHQQFTLNVPIILSDPEPNSNKQEMWFYKLFKCKAF